MVYLNPGDMVLSKGHIVLLHESIESLENKVVGYLERGQLGFVLATRRPPGTTSRLMMASLMLTAAGLLGWVWYEMDPGAVDVFPAPR